MTHNERNIEVLKRIVGYCDEVNCTLDLVNYSFDTMISDFLYKNSLAMNVLQIGELVKNLTEDFKQEYQGIPWSEIAGMRDIAAHGYGDFDFDVLWETITEDIDPLKSYCEQCIESLKL